VGARVSATGDAVRPDGARLLQPTGYRDRPQPAAWRSAASPHEQPSHRARVAPLYAAFLRGGAPGCWAGARCPARLDRGRWRRPRAGRHALRLKFNRPASRPIGASPRAFGHFGYGGSLGFADPDAGLAFGYLMNRPGERWHNPRTERLLDALYGCM
jgi:CubicO group peptidase (beta-lactamase class C family)